MVREKDRFWEYANDLKGRFKCKFCDQEFSGGATRLKCHLARLPGKDISGCTKVSEDVQAAAVLVVSSNERPNKRSRTCLEVDVDVTGSPQATVLSMYGKKDKDAVDKALANCFFMNNLSFNVVQDLAFLEFIRALSNYGPGYCAPSYSTLRTKLVQMAKKEVQEYVSTIKESWIRTGTGCTLMSDGWTDMKSRSFINVIGYSPKGAVFLKSIEDSCHRKTGAYLRDLFFSVIQEIGAENITMIITDNASNYESAGNMIVDQYPHIYKIRCAAHGINLLLKDINKEVAWVRTVFDDTKHVVDFMYKYTPVLTLMRQHTGDRELKRPCKTRFASQFLMVQSVLEVEEGLRMMVASLEFRNMNYSTSESRKGIIHIIQSTHFWLEAKDVIFVLEPIIRVLRLVDGEGSTFGYLFEAIERAKEALRKLCEKDERKYEKISSLFDTRRDSHILDDAHAVAAFLNPLLMCSGKIRYDHPKVKKGLLCIINKFFTTEVDRKAFGTQITEYNIQSPEIFHELAMIQMESVHPRIWWAQNGGPIPMVQKFAVRILSQPCSSSACERNWSAFEAAQTKKRNKLSPDMLKDLICIRMNSKMKTNANQLEKKDMRPINLDQLGELPEYQDPEESDNEEGGEVNTEDLIFESIFRIGSSQSQSQSQSQS